MDSREAKKHYNYLCREVKKPAKRNKERFINETYDLLEISRK